jgi:hypothetical protein
MPSRLHNLAWIRQKTAADEAEYEDEDDLPLEDRLRPHLPKFMAGLAASGAGLGAYRLMRRQRLSADPRLRAIQELSGGDAPHVFEGSRKNLSALQRLVNKARAGFGTTLYDEDIPLDRRGVIIHEDPAVITSGDVNIFGPQQRERLLKYFGRPSSSTADKGLEAEVFQKYAPGSVPDTTSMSRILGPLGFLKRRLGDPLSRYEAKLRQKYPQGYVLKTTGGAATGGHFPTDSKSLSEYLAGGGHQAEVVQQLLRDPSKVIAQAKIPIEQGNVLDRLWGTLRRTPSTREHRVHVFEGAVSPSTTTPRFSPLSALTTRKQLREGEDFVRGVLEKLPPELQRGSYNFDVAPVVGGGYKIIESNPGQYSGILNPGRNPLAPFLLHRDLTGRHGRLSSGLAAATAATGAGLAASKLPELLDEEDES